MQSRFSDIDLPIKDYVSSHSFSFMVLSNPYIDLLYSTTIAMDIGLPPLEMPKIRNKLNPSFVIK